MKARPTHTADLSTFIVGGVVAMLSGADGERLRPHRTPAASAAGPALERSVARAVLAVGGAAVLVLDLEQFTCLCDRVIDALRSEAS